MNVSETMREFTQLAQLTPEEAACWSSLCAASQEELCAALRPGVTWEREETRLAQAAAAAACYRYRLAVHKKEPFSSFSAGDIKLAGSAETELEAARQLKEEAQRAISDLLDDGAFAFRGV